MRPVTKEGRMIKDHMMDIRSDISPQLLDSPLLQEETRLPRTLLDERLDMLCVVD